MSPSTDGGAGAEAHFPHTFRPPVLLIYLFYSIPTQMVFVSFLGLQGWIDYGSKGLMPSDAELLWDAMASVCCGLGLIPVALVLAHRHRVRVGPYGIETSDSRGFRCLLGWNAIESVEVVKFWGWRSLRARTITGREVWLPVYVARGEAYREAVTNFAGEGHPVSRALAVTSSPFSTR